MFAGVDNVFPEQLLRDWGGRDGRWLSFFGGHGMGAAVRLDDKIGEHGIYLRVYRVADNAKDIETGENWFCEFYVLLKWYSRVVAAADRVGGGNDSTAGLQGGDDASFGDGDGLLFHCFVDGGTVFVVHFVKLVYEASAFVGEDEGTAFQRPLRGDGVFADAGSETDSRGTLAGCKDSAVGGRFDVFEELRFGGSGVA
jgi:hypothetical protein